MSSDNSTNNAVSADLETLEAIIGRDRAGRRREALRMFRKAAIASTSELEHYAAAAFTECPCASLRVELVEAGFSSVQTDTLLSHANVDTHGTMQDSEFLGALDSYSKALRAAIDAASLGPTEASTSIGAAGGEVLVNGAQITLPAGSLDGDVVVKVANISNSSDSRVPLAERTAELNQCGAKPTGAMLELQPHGTTFEKPVKLQINVPEGDENKGLVLMHRDDGTSENWEVLDTPCRAIGPGVVEVEVQAFCFMVLSFPFSGMESMRKVELGDPKDFDPWRVVYHGMALDVQCTNKECKAANERVLCNLGFTRFDFQTDWQTKVQCPQCKKPCPRGSRDTVMFYNCSWKYEGTMVDGMNKAAEGRADGCYEMERGGEMGATDDVMWERLVITTRESDKEHHRR